MSDFTGKWNSTFGPMDLVQEGPRVQGGYLALGTRCTLEGEVAGGRLNFTYQEPSVRGEGWFELTRNGKAFAGQWHPKGVERWAVWEGERVGFDGLWNSSFGLLRLVEEGDRVQGFYEVGGGAGIDGTLEGGRLLFTYQEPGVRGRGRFELAADGLSFQGEWQPEGAEGWQPWWGLRLRPQADLVWLVVIEAPWQRFLSEREYSFGGMLREFFARVPGVQVRHRFFNNEAGLRKCCRDLLYVAEPAVVVLATHALPQGLTVGGHTVAVQTVVEGLRHAGDVRLLHLSACLALQDPAVVEALRGLSRQAGFPISGYSTSVDWAASAIIEFTLLELILSRGLAPTAAAEQLCRLLPFAGDERVAGTAFVSAGFRIVTPREGA